MLLCLASDPDMRIRDLALVLGLTERSTQKILGDLVNDGYVSRTRVGRRNEYEIHIERPLPLGRELTVRHILDTFRPDEEDPASIAGVPAPDIRPELGSPRSQALDR